MRVTFTKTLIIVSLGVRYWTQAPGHHRTYTSTSQSIQVMTRGIWSSSEHYVNHEVVAIIDYWTIEVPASGVSRKETEVSLGVCSVIERNTQKIWLFHCSAPAAPHDLQFCIWSHLQIQELRIMIGHCFQEWISGLIHLKMDQQSHFL